MGSLDLPAKAGQHRRTNESVNYPGQLNDAVARWLQASGAGSARLGAQQLQAAYRAGAASAAGDLKAYLTARLPATFAVNKRVMAEVAARLPGFAPQSVLDCGAGPGTAAWAAVAQWAGVVEVTALEALAAFHDLAIKLNAESGVKALASARFVLGDMRSAVLPSADLVTASYVLAELPQAEASAVALRMWRNTKGALVLIEPGTPKGFARIHAARNALRGEAHVVAPCTHNDICPMEDGDWCHFKVRLQRSRAHMHAKAAEVPFEDESYSYLVVSRMPANKTGSRIIAPVTSTKVATTLQTCDASGLHALAIASRDKPAYKRAKKARWGDVWE
jgi:ribosomal protein RSM22 (predicted rRNA methylase)